MIVYNITQRSSFEYAAKCLAEFKSLQNAPTAYLVGNKADLDHLREVRASLNSFFLLFYSLKKSIIRTGNFYFKLGKNTALY